MIYARLDLKHYRQTEKAAEWTENKGETQLFNPKGGLFL